jgi:hypothetical protein
MGMSIEQIIKYLPAPICGSTFVGKEKQKEYDAHDLAIIIMRKYQQLQSDYENRLKADMVAMLTEIQLEIEELDTPNNGSAYMDCVEIIQQKIDALKGENT